MNIIVLTSNYNGNFTFRFTDPIYRPREFRWTPLLRQIACVDQHIASGKFEAAICRAVAVRV